MPAREGGRAIEQRGELEPAPHKEPRLHVPGRQGPLDREALAKGNEALALERQAHELDDLLGQVREVADGLVADLAALAPGAPQQVRDVLALLALPPVGDDVNRASRPRLSPHDTTIPH